MVQNARKRMLPVITESRTANVSVVIDEDDARSLRVGGFDDADDGGEVDTTRKPRVRARTVSIRRLSKRELERGRMLYPEVDYERPHTRADCLHGPHADRPCPFVSCKHHLYLDVNERTGSIKLNFPDVEVWDLPETCGLDVADRGGMTLEEVGEIMNLTRERIRQLECRSIARLKALGAMASLSDYCDE